MATRATAASRSVGAAAATKSPSRTITTPVIDLAAVSSYDVSVAPKEGGRRTLPFSIPAGRRSGVYWWRPVTKSRASTFGMGLPATVQSDGAVIGSSAGRFFASDLPRAKDAYVRERPNAGSGTFAFAAFGLFWAPFHSFSTTPME